MQKRDGLILMRLQALFLNQQYLQSRHHYPLILQLQQLQRLLSPLLFENLLPSTLVE